LKEALVSERVIRVDEEHLGAATRRFYARLDYQRGFAGSGLAVDDGDLSCCEAAAEQGV
jgi:hypothetical protein